MPKLGQIQFSGFRHTCMVLTRFSGRTDSLTHSLTDGQTRLQNASGTVLTSITYASEYQMIYSFRVQSDSRITNRLSNMRQCTFWSCGRITSTHESRLMSDNLGCDCSTLTSISDRWLRSTAAIKFMCIDLLCCRMNIVYVDLTQCEKVMLKQKHSAMSFVLTLKQNIESVSRPK